MSFVKRRIRELLLWLVNSFFCGTRMFGAKRRLLNACAGITVGKGTKVVGPLRVSNCSVVTIGEDCWIGTGMTVWGDGAVTVGDRCDLAPEVSFLTGSHEIGTAERRAGAGRLYRITVGNGCWLGAKSALTNDITVGDGAVVGACALVNKNVAANTAVAGVPAKVIKEL